MVHVMGARNCEDEGCGVSVNKVGTVLSMAISRSFCQVVTEVRIINVRAAACSWNANFGVTVGMILQIGANRSIGTLASFAISGSRRVYILRVSNLGLMWPPAIFNSHWLDHRASLHRAIYVLSIHLSIQ